MGFKSSATTTELTAKLTPLGRERLITSNSGLITQFSLGDSDANYGVTLSLGSGEVPTQTGNLTTVSGETTNSTTTNVFIKNVIYYTGVTTRKPVQSSSVRIVSSLESIGQNIISGTSLSHNLIYKSATTTDALVNLYQSFNLPISATDILRYTGRTFTQGGFSDTAISGFSNDLILAIGIDNSTYGNMLDGKEIKIDLETTLGSAYTIYSTFQNKGDRAALDDNKFTETSSNTTQFGTNYAILFSDLIMRPNGGDATKSWATGFATTKPFSANRKSRYNLTTNTALSQTADTAVGIAFLDKGFIIITEPTIVNNFTIDPITGTSSATTVTFDSLSSKVSQEILCLADRGEFTRSNNPTFTDGDTPRISEIGLYDNNGNLIAFGKTDRHLTKTANEFIALAVRINL